MIGYKKTPPKVIIGKWDIGKMMEMQLPKFKNIVMNQEIKLSKMNQFRNFYYFMKIFIVQKIVYLMLRNF